jgi:non-specific serine/threonine protein kinase/serine/threonine-protein kinase
MDNDGFNRLKRIFDGAFGLPESERSGYLDRECADDPELREMVERLLAQPTERADLDDLIREINQALPTRNVEQAPTRRRIGPYRLLEKIGEGGMGEVWVAEQTEPVRRRVALKLIKRGMDSDQVVARFEAERQALAMMDHPAIAKVFDAGQTDDGRPYFVMEYVDGLPVTEHCDKHKLTTRERLDLFVRVCEGVQHAHQKAIIHRDIKPTNVLVTLQDDKPVPKIIDFGVAKAVEQRLTERTLYTELGVLVGTPAYMSPEQADLTGKNIDTRTDVYALGVLLYELLTGVLPFDPRDLREAGFEEIIRKIREDDPPRPSARVSAVDKLSTLSARNRGAEPGTLTRQIRGDLDWITMKALEKDRARRYGSVSDLATEIGRYLRDEPVLAGPPSGIYRARKFIKRHRVAVTVVTLVAVMLVAFSIVTTIQARRIAREAATAEQVSEFLVELFEVSDPSESRGNTITAREILDQGAEKIETELTDQPAVQARLMRTMAEVYFSVGLFEPAGPFLERATERFSTIFGQRHPETLRTRSMLGSFYRIRGRLEEAEEVLATVLAAQRERLGRHHPDSLETMRRLAWLRHDQSRYEVLEEMHVEILEARRRILGEGHEDTITSMRDLADAYGHANKDDEKEKLLWDAVEVQRRTLGDDHPETLIAQSQFAWTFAKSGDYEEAQTRMEGLLEPYRRVFGENHPTTADLLYNLANVYERAGQTGKAVRTVQEAIELWGEARGARHPDTLQAIQHLGAIYVNLGRFDDAGPLLEEALAVQREVVGADHEDTRRTMRWLAILDEREGRYSQAASRWREVLDANRSVYGTGDHRTVAMMTRLGRSLEQAGQATEAEAMLREAVTVARENLGEDHFESLEAQTRLGNLLLNNQRYAEAEEVYSGCADVARELPPERRYTLGICAYLLACTKAVQGRTEEALDWLRQAAEAGFNQKDPATSSMFDDLAGDPEFEALVERLRVNRSRG